MRTTHVSCFLSLVLALGCTNVGSTTDHTSEPQNADALALAPAEECGASYPKGFPCLRGGRAWLDEPRASPFPGTTVLGAVEYPISPRSLSNRIVVAATTAGWSNQGTEEGVEPDGVRYRTRFVRGDTVLAISVWPRGSGAVLQIIHLERR
jgi:hypothetical protein